jgi:ELWxxDGT repeat protein
MVVLGNDVLFVAWAPAYDDELWATDGSPTGTRRLTTIQAPRPFRRQASAYPYFFRRVVDRALFLVDDVIHGQELWVSDGSAAGTRALTSFGFARPFVGGTVDIAARFGDTVLFGATTGLEPPRLWTVPIRGGLVRPLSGCAGACPVRPGALWDVGPRRVLFWAKDASGVFRLMATDGTGPGTRTAVEPLAWNEVRAVVSGRDRLFLVGDEEIWQTDGTAAGTFRILDKDVGADVSLQTVGDFHYFGVGSWVVASARIVSLRATATARPKTVGHLEVRRSSSWPGLIAGVPAGVVFCAESGAGSHLWFSDGSGARNLDVEGRFGCPPHGFVPLANGRVVFFHSYSALGSVATPVGPAQLIPPPDQSDASMIEEVIGLGDRAVIVYQSRVGAETRLATWDGIAAAAVDVLPLTGQLAGASRFRSVGPGQLTFFVGEALWVTDLTPNGTRSVATIPQFQRFLATRPDGRLVFLAADQVVEVNLATGATVALGPLPSMQIVQSVVWSDRVLILGLGQYPGSQGEELWSIKPGQAPARLAGFELTFALYDLVNDDQRFAIAEDGAYFVAKTSAFGEELWVTDGTAAGTRIVTDLRPGPAPSASGAVATAADGRVIFTAVNSLAGYEPRITDGLTVELLHDVWPGIPGSNPGGFTTSNGKTFFRADDGRTGMELWVYEP